MVRYDPPTRDYQFLFHEVFGVCEEMQKLGFEEFDREFVDMMMDEWGDFTNGVWLPTNAPGDVEGAKYLDGRVTTPSGFKEAWAATVEAGWLATVCELEHGGLGQPLLFRNAMDEFAISTNMALSALAALCLGVYDLVTDHGEDSLQELYAPKVATGEWCGTMCLTEPHCGTDLGMIHTKAEPRDDGSYLVSGTKIFITGGEHDLTPNIVHMVLARLPDAPSGTKGISLFLVPKYLPSDYQGGIPKGCSDDLSDSVNGVVCSSIEKKMGLHGQPTCVMNFEQSVGWLVGEPNRGMALMFEMMNRERLATGMMGLGLGEVAYQNALDWCKERRQGRDLKGVNDPEEEADNILVHPDVRRMLLRTKANNEGCRALGTWIGLQLDKSGRAEGEEQDIAKALVAVLTPVAKAHMTDIGCESTFDCIQVMGGAGYIQESGVEQFYRDVRIAPIWEGTNGIQALDLVGRKIALNLGRDMRHLLWPMLEFIEENRDIEGMAEFTKPLYQGVRGLQQITLLLMAEGMANPHFLAAGATDYCRYLGNIVLGYMWARMAKVSLEKRGEDPFYDAKLATARIFFERIYPETISLAAKVQAGHRNLMEYPEAMM